MKQLTIEEIAQKNFFFVDSGFGVLTENWFDFVYVTDEAAVIQNNNIFCTKMWQENFLSHF